MTTSITTFRIPQKLKSEVLQYSKAYGVTQSAAFRMLIGRGLGKDWRVIYVSEKVEQIRQLVSKRMDVVLVKLRDDLLAAVDDVTASSKPLPPPDPDDSFEADDDEDDEEEAIEPEPEVKPVRGVKRGAAKARRRR